MQATRPLVDNCPPRVPGTALENVVRWLDSFWSSTGASGVLDRVSLTSMRRVGPEFLESIEDIPGHRTLEVRRRILAARSLQDLWHLRSEIFALVSHAHDQAEAQQRLTRLNRHFPTRSARSGFAPLDSGRR